MDVHVFRRFGDALSPLLIGSRLEKIQSPFENVFVLTVYARQKKHHLVIKVGRRGAFCFFAKDRPIVNAAPSALVMRWRKYCVGRRISSCTIDWVGRRIFLLFHTHNVSSSDCQNSKETWLVLDLKEGLQLVLGKTPKMDFFEQDVAWPLAEDISFAMEQWRQWPVLSPSLRRFLPTLELLECKSLLVDLEFGGGDLYVYERLQDNSSFLSILGSEDKFPIISAWPLSFSSKNNIQESVFEDPLEATTYVGSALVFEDEAKKESRLASLPHQREVARLQKLLIKLHEDEKRLKGMVQAQELGLILQKELWKYPVNSKYATLTTEDSPPLSINLDLKLTLSENMQAFFHKADRGRRGLEYLKKRILEVETKLNTIASNVSMVQSGVLLQYDKKNIETKKNMIDTLMKALPKGIQAFKSSDGFIILRGKDAKGNGAVLRSSSPRDIWLHVEGGPGSHCVIRRQFIGQDIPEKTFLEAASLAAVKSWQRENHTAQILCAEVRYVKPMRNASLGTVRIDKVLKSFKLNIIVNIEDLLIS